MKKLLVVIVVVLVAAVTIGPFVAGIAAEKAFRSMVAQLEQEMEVPIATTYQRGWFGATAETTVDAGAALRKQLPPRMEEMAKEYGSITVKSVHHISHGPLPIGNGKPGTTIPMPALAHVRDVHSIDMPEGIGMDREVTTHTVINFDTSVETLVDIAPFCMALDDGGTVDVKRVTGTVTMPPGLKGLSCDMTWPGMTIEGGKGSAAVGGMTLQCTKRKGASGMNVGSINLGIASCAMINGEDEQAEIEGFTLKGQSDEQGELLKGQATLSFANAVIETNIFGPGSATMTVENLHAPTVKELLKVARAFQDKDASPLAMLPLLAKVGALMTDLLSRSPRIEVKECSLTTPDGNVTAVAVIKTTQPTGGKVELNDLFGLLDVEAVLKVPEQLMAKRIEDDQDAAARFVKKDGAYELRFTVRDGEMTLNGEPFNPMGRARGGRRGGGGR